jgi:hypothetical protein
VETTNPINGNDLEAVADNLIMDTPSNSEAPTDEVVEATEDTQPDIIEDDGDDQDVVEASSDDDYDDVEDVEVEVDEAPQEPEMYTVKVDGEERQVSLEELTRGYSGQKYIQKGMSEVAEQRKQYEQLTNETAQERQMLQQMMQRMQQGNVPVIPEYPAEELKESDPFRFQMEAEEYRRAVEQRQQWEQQVQYVQQREQQENERLQQEYLTQQAMRLAEWMPEFADKEKRTAFIQDMTTKAKRHYQLTDDQISTVKTAEEVMILNDALKWRELQSGKTKAKQKVEGARPVVKSAAKRSAQAGKVSRAKKAEAAMREKGDIDSVANFLLS